ncbi:MULTISPECIES: TomO hydrophobic C-terminal domain-containing protein [Wolbachia]|uniref:Uncharacterized protein n=1 Tax=Wolbachia pipientis TaxID=955 RepID=A0A7G5CCI8_WOLPI|nr:MULTISPECIES: hypothetical protein [Wolbachia]MDE5061089.1 hypothetical protein [Wolbachia endosymbiont of Drosophila nikananu]QMV46922.1 hypothetical protein HC356_02330 [Wolbachia pipientis]
MSPKSSQGSVGESNHNKVPEQVELIFVGGEYMSDLDKSIFYFDPSYFAFSNTLIHLSSPCHQIFTSNLCDSIDEAELSDRIGVAGASRLAEPTSTIATALNEMRELIKGNPSQLRCLEKIVAGVQSLTHEAEELIKRGDGRTCHKNSLENLAQGVHETKKRLQLKEDLSVSLDKENQELSEQNDQLKEENRKLLAKNNKLKTQLTRANAEVEELSWKSKDGEDRLLKQKRNEFNNEYKHISRSEEVKDLDIQTEDIGALQERAELNDYRRKVVELEEKLGMANAGNKQLTSSNSFLKERIKQLKEELRLKDSQPNSTEKTIFDEIKEADQQQMGILQMDLNLREQLESKNGLESQIRDLQKQLESKNKELNGKNEKFLEASTHSKRQGKCASVFFVLSCVFAVGASLTMSYLAICISLAVAASVFLIVGCCCSYKANTALSNVEVDNGVNPAVVEV